MPNKDLVEAKRIVADSGNAFHADANRRAVKVTVNYPVILCNSFEKCFRVDMEKETEPVAADERLLLELNYAYINSNERNMSEYFLVDVVALDQLPGFLGAIEQGADAMGFMLSE